MRRSSRDFIGRVYKGIRGIVPALADGVAEIEDVSGSQAGVGVGLQTDLEPLVLDSVVGEGDGDAGVVVLDRTPFYAESGGQVGDRGEIVGSAGTFIVADTQKIQSEVFGHNGTLKTGTLKVGDKVEARVDVELRRRTMRNHSVTHLMHKALREVLGAGPRTLRYVGRPEGASPAEGWAEAHAAEQRRIISEVFEGVPAHAR